jgi:hypothetical protein
MSSSRAYCQTNSAYAFPSNVKHQVSQLYHNSKQAKTITDWTAARYLQFNLLLISSCHPPNT